MKAVILCAGEGTRLRPFTNSRPKVMIEIANKPIVQYVVEALIANSIKDIIMVTGYKKENIMSYFGDGKQFGARIKYIVEPKQIGTAHALSMAKEQFKKGDSFLALPGDNIIDADLLSDIIRCKEENCVVITESDQPSKYGVMVMDGRQVSQVIEKPETEVGNLISTGIYKFTPEIFNHIEEILKAGKVGLSDVLELMLDKKIKIRGIRSRGLWMDAVYPWDLVRMNGIAVQDVKKSTAGKIERGVTMIGDVVIGKGTVIRSGCYIHGPVIIGEGCEIGPDVYISQSTTIGHDVSIKPFTSVESSVIMDGSYIGYSSHLSRTVIGWGVRIGNNFSSSSGTNDIKSGSNYHTVDNIGSMIGEDTAIKDNVVALPGTIIGAGSKIHSVNRLRGRLPDKSTVL